MRVFISESVCGGAWYGLNRPPSLAREGRAMLTAVLEDAGGVPGINVCTTWDSSLGDPPANGAAVHIVSSRAEEYRVFAELAGECDRTLVIAPETDAVLEARCRMVLQSGGTLAGPAPEAIALAADKLALSQHLEAHAISAIPTQAIPEDGNDSQIAFPCVIKPRDGAGSQDVSRVASAEELLYRVKAGLDNGIWQPYVAGQAVSVVVISQPGHLPVAWPVAEQCLDDNFQYQGGRIPAAIARPDEVARTAIAACQTIPGLHGYVGVDLIVPADGQPPIVVEINPRLTTSYLGYRQLAAENLAPWVLGIASSREPAWRDGSISFAP